MHELIPWRTLTGRQHFYQDHPWMLAFGEGFTLYKPPIDTKTIDTIIDEKDNGNPQVVLNFITPAPEVGHPLHLHRQPADADPVARRPIIWISETDANGGIEDNDWVEAYNRNGTLVARAVVSQRIQPGTTLMYHAQEKMTNVPGSEITGRAAASTTR